MEVRRFGNIFGEEKGTSFAGNVWDINKLSPTLTNMQGGCRQPMIVENPKELGFMDNGTGKHQSNTVYDENALCPNITTIQGGGTQQIKIAESQIVAMRGRNPTNPSDRTPGIETEQRLEPNTHGTCNTLTSVQKDNLVMEPQLVGGIGEKWGDKQYRQGNRVYNYETVSMAITSQPIGNLGGNSYLYLTKQPLYRIRKLTPRECWRLMDFSDEDFEKAAEVNSNTQLYKQAGNSIVKNVLIAIFGQMIPGKGMRYLRDECE